MYGLIAKILGFGRLEPALRKNGFAKLAVESLEQRDCPAISIVSSTICNEGGIALLTVKLDRPAYQAISFSYATINGTAASGQDYVNTSRTARFQPNRQYMEISINTLTDTLVEGDERFYVKISGASVSSVESTCSVTIKDLTGKQLIGISKYGTIPADIEIYYRAMQSDGKLKSFSQNLHLSSTQSSGSVIADQWSNIVGNINIGVTISNSGVPSYFSFSLSKKTNYHVSIKTDTGVLPGMFIANVT
jgi:hypothetical protein